ncbi:Bgt-50097 [Blumeria graminis f. sp. tritici]|uniref:non-specific serine/threonine protein kinase n=1 Tax=Blumeria graminis f. sp. tritici TaxID=62690 RepID=A0A9X9L7S9_BLUGR|nr:Bgt-50097 [Blumeria graminis f. sp. tritici]
MLDRFRTKYETMSNPMKAIDGLIYNLHQYTMDFDGNATIATLDNQLAELITMISKKEVSISDFEVLTASIHNSASDSQIWASVIDTTNKILREPSSNLPVSKRVMMQKQHTSTSKKRNIAESNGYGKVANDLTQALKAELAGKVYRNVGNFWETQFENKAWSDLTLRIWQSYCDHGQCGSDNVFSADMDEAAMQRWLYAFQDRFLKQLMSKAEKPKSDKPVVKKEPKDPKVQGKFCHTTKTKEFDGGLSERKLDFFIESATILDCQQHNWRDVRVVGELTASPGQKADKIHQLMRYVREIFYAQPLRRFVQGFCLHQNHVELWVVDRAGAYSSAEIDVIKSQEALVRALSSYMLMNDEELGLDPIIRYNEDDRCFVNIPRGTKKQRIIEISPQPVYRPETISSRGNTCFKTRDNKYLIKFSWGSGAKRSELEYLELAKKLPGVIHLKRSKSLYEVETHRKGIDFSSGYIWEMNSEGVHLSHGKTMDPKVEDYYMKRELTFAKLSPFGRPLNSCSTVREFVGGIRDAIIGHRNLHEIQILHGDVSEGNIILFGPNHKGVTKGLLIDLDMSTLLQDSRDNDEAKVITGTTKFMALGLLEGIRDKDFSIQQTYRHDLESFFYVLLVGCMSYGRDPESVPDHLEQWCTPSSAQNYGMKLSHIVCDFEKRIIGFFSPKFECLKDLARTIRKILFGQPTLSGERFMEYGTPENSDLLYDPIIVAFNETILKLEGKKYSRFTQNECPLFYL